MLDCLVFPHFTNRFGFDHLTRPNQVVPSAPLACQRQHTQYEIERDHSDQTGIVSLRIDSPDEAEELPDTLCDAVWQ